MNEDWEEDYLTYSGKKKAVIWFLCITASWMVVIGVGWGLANIF